MQYFYDGQIRRYLTQVVRLLSNFVVRYGDGTLVRVPVMYGDADRQAATIINQNSANTIQSTPRIAVYVTDLDLDRTRLGDSTHVSKVHIRERDIEDGYYTGAQGANYTVERLMPTPFNLSMKADIWSSSTEQKLQILEQILVLFNPSLEIQTTDNFVDWTSLSVVELEDIAFSSRSVPVGTNTAIDIATLTLKTPIYLTPPAKVKKLGIITSIIANLYGNIGNGPGDYIEGLGTFEFANDKTIDELLATFTVTNGDFDIFVEGNNITISNNAIGAAVELNWPNVFAQIPGKLIAGLSKIFLTQANGTEVVGTISVNPIDGHILNAEWDPDTFPSNNYIDEDGNIQLIDPAYDNNTGKNYFNAVIDPTQFNPKRPNKENVDQPITTGIRYLIIDSIGGGMKETFTSTSKIWRINTGAEFDRVQDCTVIVDGVTVSLDTPYNKDGVYVIVLSNPIPSGSTVTYILNYNTDGPDCWKNSDNSDVVANANDIIMWDGSNWRIIFDGQKRSDIIIHQTNLYTTTQYKWNGVSWVKSFEGEYRRGQWRLAL
jgi:hypothetical protein